MELLENFGFEPVFFIAQIINFLILAFVFKRYLYKPILKVLRDREKAIAQGLEDAQNARVRLEEADARKDEILKSAAIAAEKIIDETKKNAEKLREELMSRSKSDAEKIIIDAQKQASSEMKKAEEQAKVLSLELGRKILGRLLDELFTKQEKEIILQRNIRKLKEYE